MNSFVDKQVVQQQASVNKMASHILSVNVHILSVNVHILSVNVHILSVNVHILSVNQDKVKYMVVTRIVAQYMNKGWQNKPL